MWAMGRDHRASGPRWSAAGGYTKRLWVLNSGPGRIWYQGLTSRVDDLGPWISAETCQARRATAYYWLKGLDNGVKH